MAEENLDTGLVDAGESGDSVHDDVARAFDVVEAREQNREPPPVDKVAPPPAPGGAPSSPDAGERARGPDGKFVAQPDADKPALKAPAAPALGVKPNGATPPAGAPQRQQGAPDKAPPAEGTLRPPVSWKPQAREHWAKLPPEVQQEVARREGEVSRVMKESASAREALNYVQQVVGPYAANIQASGSDALGFISNMMKADNTLRHGSVSDKAGLVASIIQQYGVDIAALDAVLAGQTPRADPNDALRRELDARLQPIMQTLNRFQGRESQARERIAMQGAQSVEDFGADATHEFFEDVRQDMADLIEMATRRGEEMSLQDAYDRAIMINPQLREIVSKRAETERATAAAQAAQRARRAAASLTSSPAPAGTPGLNLDDRRAVIEAAWDQHSG